MPLSPQRSRWRSIQKAIDAVLPTEAINSRSAEHPYGQHCMMSAAMEAMVTSRNNADLPIESILRAP